MLLRGPHTKADVDEKKRVRKESTAVLRTFNNEFIVYSTVVTALEKEAAGNRRRSAGPSAIPPPRALVVVEVAFPGVHLLELLRIHGAGETDPRSDYGVRIYFGLSGIPNAAYPLRVNTPPLSHRELPYSVFTRKRRCLFNFEGESGATVYFCLNYENKKGNPGPFGSIFSVTIP
ncbi:MAG: hypothetical protein LBG42_07980 [Treponema sp.]|nr:hypothetical protein [Treponema sp.]